MRAYCQHRKVTIRWPDRDFEDLDLVVPTCQPDVLAQHPQRNPGRLDCVNERIRTAEAQRRKREDAEMSSNVDEDHPRRASLNEAVQLGSGLRNLLQNLERRVAFRVACNVQPGLIRTRGVPSQETPQVVGGPSNRSRRAPQEVPHRPRNGCPNPGCHTHRQFRYLHRRGGTRWGPPRLAGADHTQMSAARSWRLRSPITFGRNAVGLETAIHDSIPCGRHRGPSVSRPRPYVSPRWGARVASGSSRAGRRHRSAEPRSRFRRRRRLRASCRRP